MSLKVAQNGGEFEMVPEGQYIARCFKVVDLGTQTTEYMGEKKLQSKVYISWEILDDVKMKDGRPFAVSQMYTASLNEKSRLYKDLSAWRGKKFTADELLGFDISKLLGAYCQVQIVHNEVGDKTFANINAIMGTKERPDGINPTVMFDMENPDMSVFNDLGAYLQGKIQLAPEWRVRDGDERPEDAEGMMDDAEEIDVKDIPF